MAEEKYGLQYVAIVAIVAIVGIIMVMNGHQAYTTETVSGENLVGQGFGGGTCKDTGGCDICAGIAEVECKKQPDCCTWDDSGGSDLSTACYAME